MWIDERSLLSMIWFRLKSLVGLADWSDIVPPSKSKVIYISDELQVRRVIKEILTSGRGLARAVDHAEELLSLARLTHPELMARADQAVIDTRKGLDSCKEVGRLLNELDREMSHDQ